MEKPKRVLICQHKPLVLGKSTDLKNSNLSLHENEVNILTLLIEMTSGLLSNTLQHLPFKILLQLHNIMKLSTKWKLAN